MDVQDIRNLQEAYLEVYQLDEKEDSPYEKASDAALDARYGYGRAQGDKRSFGRAANRASAAAALRAIRRGKRSGSGTSREAGADAVHQGWARTARTSTDQTPEKKEKRKKLADTPYSNLPDDEKEKDRVSFDAVRATYNRNKTQKEETDLYDIILSHLLDEGYAETQQAAEAIMVNMSEDWREDIVEGRGEDLRAKYGPNPAAKLSKRAFRKAMSYDNRDRLATGQTGTEARAQYLGLSGAAETRSNNQTPIGSASDSQGRSRRVRSRGGGGGGIGSGANRDRPNSVQADMAKKSRGR
jgi:hypothetical protein